MEFKRIKACRKQRVNCWSQNKKILFSNKFESAIHFVTADLLWDAIHGKHQRRSAVR